MRGGKKVWVTVIKGTRMRHSMVEDAVQMLERGQDVVGWLREKCVTTASLSVALSRVKSEWMEGGAVPPEVALRMGAHTSEPGVRAFLSSPLSEMVRVQREHRSDPRWSEGAEETLQSLHLLPPNVEALKLSHKELISLKRKRETTLIAKQETLLHVHNATNWLQCAIVAARTATPDMSLPRLALPLLLLSGRRATEILNGKSTFEATGRLTTCIFTGQIKKRGGDTPYEIPLLCDYASFRHCLDVLRRKQEGEVLEAAECNRRYAHLLNDETRNHFSFATHTHQLRGVYASMVFHLYSSDVTFNRAAMKFLGHEKLEISLSYNSVVLHDTPPAGSWGLLP